MTTTVRRNTRWIGALALLFAVLSTLSTAPAGANVTKSSSKPLFYLDIGASESVGVQPTVLYPHGQLTSEGYANDLVQLMAARGVALKLTELGCPGESTTTALYGGDRCYHQRSTQIADAIAFLQAHQSDRGIVTIDLGFNDLRPCIHQGFSDPTCATTAAAKVQSQLTTIVKELKAAAGPQVTFVGLNHNDPFLAAMANVTHNLKMANTSASAMAKLNETLNDVYAKFGIPVAKVTKAFASNVDTRVHVAHFGRLPKDVAAACTMTWMCQTAPYGPNIHPNAQGYLAMAKAIESALPSLP